MLHEKKIKDKIFDLECLQYRKAMEYLLLFRFHVGNGFDHQSRPSIAFPIMIHYNLFMEDLMDFLLKLSF